MRYTSTSTDGKITSFILAGCVVLLAWNILFAPEAAFHASLTGVEIWWNYIFPVLLPYFILMEIVLNSGSLPILTKKLHPISVRLCGLSGSGLAVILSGWMAGYPAGAKFTALAVKNHAISAKEGEKVLLLSHMCNPVLTINLAAFIFLKDPLAGPFLLIIQWISAWIILLCYHLDNPVELTPIRSVTTTNLYEPMPAFGKLLSQAVKTSVQQLFLIGGIVIFFSVAIHSVSAFTHLHALFASITEVHLGLYYISKTEIAHLLKISLISAMLTFGGISVHMQVKSLINNTSLRYRSFLNWKTLQSGVTTALTVLMWHPYKQITSTSPVVTSFLNEQMRQAQPLIPTFWEWPMVGVTFFGCFIIFLFFMRYWIRKSYDR